MTEFVSEMCALCSSNADHFDAKSVTEVKGLGLGPKTSTVGAVGLPAAAALSNDDWVMIDRGIKAPGIQFTMGRKAAAPGNLLQAANCHFGIWNLHR